MRFVELNAVADLKIYKEYEFAKAIEDHDMQVLFCLFLPHEACSDIQLFSALSDRIVRLEVQQTL
jgi:hypothetical protein